VTTSGYVCSSPDLRVPGQVGSAMLLAVPVTARVNRRPVPPVVVATVAITVLGAGIPPSLFFVNSCVLPEPSSLRGGRCGKLSSPAGMS